MSHSSIDEADIKRALDDDESSISSLIYTSVDRQEVGSGDVGDQNYNRGGGDDKSWWLRWRGKRSSSEEKQKHEYVRF